MADAAEVKKDVRHAVLTLYLPNSSGRDFRPNELIDDPIFYDLGRRLAERLHDHHYYGIRNHTLSWIGAFLSNRTQTTVVNGVHSSYVEVASGVPQGSVLGPMLFLLYINDINNAIKSQIKLFADDSVLYRNTRNQNDQVILQNDLDTISSWA